MPESIAIHVQHPRWKNLLRPYGRTVRAACSAALASNKAGLTVVLADDAFIRELNKTYRGEDKPTNVLAFSHYPARSKARAQDPVLMSFAGAKDMPQDKNLGDLILALETVEREAKEQGKSFKDHAAHLLVHGTLHLLGYDHARPKDAERMEALEIKLLKNMGIRNPYL